MKEASRTRHKEEDKEEQDFLRFARYLGIDPEKDPDLLWIAEEAMFAPLPPGWKSEPTVVPTEKVGGGLPQARREHSSSGQERK